MTQPLSPPTHPAPPSAAADAVEGATGAESGGKSRQAATAARAKIGGWSAGAMATLIVALLGVGVTMLVQTLNTNSNRISDINGSVISLQSSVDSRFAETNHSIDRFRDRMFTEFDKVDASVDARFDKVDASMDARFDKVDAEFDKVDAEFDKVDAEFNRVDARFDEVDARFDRLEAMLVALVASLGQTDAVDNALEGRLTGIGAEPG